METTENFYRNVWNDLITTKIMHEKNSKYKHIWQRSTDNSEFYYVGIITKTTKKGFYYRDNFGVIIYVSWNKLSKIT